MPFAHLVPRFFAAVRQFSRAQRGNVAVTFAFAAMPVFALVGAAVDYSRANSVKADLQAALDATALMLSKEAATDSSGELQANAFKYFTANFNRPYAAIKSVSAAYTTAGGSQILLKGSVTVPTQFMEIFGQSTITVSDSSTVKWGNSRLRVALVLDNTGSMADNGKMTALQTATKNLLSQLQSAATTNGDVYVSIIPFEKDVNIGASNYTESYIDWTDWDAYNGTCSKSGNNNDTKAGCLKINGAKWTPTNRNKWKGCVTDRGLPYSTGNTTPSSGDYDENVTQPISGNVATLFPAEQDSYCPQAAMGLSYNWSAMASLVTAMTPNGGTNQPIGLVWGWQTLVGGGPFTAPAMDPNYTYNQVIILLTDGLNTWDRWYGNGTSTNTSVDHRMYDKNGRGTCANIKAAGITIYTIQVNTSKPADPTSTLLQNCASGSNKFFLLTSANQIVTTFNAIGTNLSNLYVAK